MERGQERLSVRADVGGVGTQNHRESFALRFGQNGQNTVL